MKRTPWLDCLAGTPLRLGVVAAVITFAIDQATKLWLLYGFDLPDHGRVRLAAVLDLVLAWNTGISYGLFQGSGALSQWMLFAAKLIAVLLLCLWLARTASRLSGFALGLILGGAIGNAVDRVLHGAVMDFILFHISASGWTFQWYVFNLADAAIVAGVVGLLYESLFTPEAPQKRPDVSQ
jgi:signal peptidase II